MMLFYAIFDSLGSKPYDPELFGKALPCLTAIGSSISPDCALTSGSKKTELEKALENEGGMWNPCPVVDSRVGLTNELNAMTTKFAEHFHDSWAACKLEKGWKHGVLYSRQMFTHPRLVPFSLLQPYVRVHSDHTISANSYKLCFKEKEFYKERCAECLRALIVWGYQFELVDHDANERANQNRVLSGHSARDFDPRPIDLSSMNLEKDMTQVAEQMAENSHVIWARKVCDELAEDERQSRI